MFKTLIKKYAVVLLLYFFVLLTHYLFGLKIWSTYVNYFLYFCIALLIYENFKISKLNRDIILLFGLFYIYISIFLLFSITLQIAGNRSINYMYFLYTDVLLSLFILFIAAYLLIYSLNLSQDHFKKVLMITFLITVLLAVVNYHEFLWSPQLVSYNKQWTVYVGKSYLFKLLNIFLIFLFWVRYYQKHFVLSEYLNIIIFLFMITNVLEALHYIAFQHKLKFFVYGQYFNLIINALTLFVWYIRLEYLHTDIARENERYLMNFRYLDGLVNKPKPGILQAFINKVSPNWLWLSASIAAFGFFLLYFLKLINVYLMVNTVFIILVTLMAVYFSLSSIRRDWHNQIGYIFKNKSKLFQ